jgi:hypothetical protein
MLAREVRSRSVVCFLYVLRPLSPAPAAAAGDVLLGCLCLVALILSGQLTPLREVALRMGPQQHPRFTSAHRECQWHLSLKAKPRGGGGFR